MAGTYRGLNLMITLPKTKPPPEFPASIIPDPLPVERLWQSLTEIARCPVVLSPGRLYTRRSPGGQSLCRGAEVSSEKTGKWYFV